MNEDKFGYEKLGKEANDFKIFNNFREEQYK